MYSSSETQRAFEAAAVNSLPTAINRLVGEGVVSIVGVQIETPQPSDALKKNVEDIEITKGAAKAEEEKANAQIKAQEAKNRLAAKEYDKDRLCIQVYDKQTCAYFKLAESGKVQFIPQGSQLHLTP